MNFSFTLKFPTYTMTLEYSHEEKQNDFTVGDPEIHILLASSTLHNFCSVLIYSLILTQLNQFNDYKRWYIHASSEENCLSSVEDLKENYILLFIFLQIYAILAHFFGCFFSIHFSFKSNATLHVCHALIALCMCRFW